MPLTSEDLYKVHVQNLRSVRAGLDQVERALRAALSRQDFASSTTLLRLLLLLIGSWAECRLKKLLYEPNGFNDQQRTIISGEQSQIDSWRKAVEIGFRSRYARPNATLPAALPATPRLRYTALLDAINSDLKPIIEMRNALAHGQWERPLNSIGTEIANHMIAALKAENALSAHFKLTILEALAGTLHDLVAGNAAFERDFDHHFVVLENARRNLARRSYSDWQAAMIKKCQSGKALRDANLRA